LLHNPQGANSIQFLTMISDLFRTAMMFLELERIERDSLSEGRDLKLYELMDFIFDGMGWDCHLGLQEHFRRGS